MSNVNVETEPLLLVYILVTQTMTYLSEIKDIWLFYMNVCDMRKEEEKHTKEKTSATG